MVHITERERMNAGARALFSKQTAKPPTLYREANPDQ